MADGFTNFPASIDLNIKKVQPQTEIYLASGIEWDNNYIHVRAFSSATDLLNHVISKVPDDKFHIQNSAPVRTGNLTVRIEANEAVAMKLNYMAFRNMPYESTWHFAFINNVTWLSSDSVLIDFELDIFSECFYTTNFKPCFVERMHIPKAQDVAGANVVPDDIETGVMECYHHTTLPLGNMRIGVYVTELPSGGEEPAGTNHMFNNVYSGLISGSYDNEDGVNALIKLYDDAGKPDALQMIYMFPSICQNSAEATEPQTLEFSTAIDLDFPYSPKNQKLFTYPYVYCILDDNGGNVNVYKPELFSGNNYEFKATGVRAVMPAVYVRPTNYNGQTEDHSHSFSMQNFPICAWTNDTFKAWVAQNKNTLALSAITQAGNVLTGGVKGALVGSALGGVSGIAGTIGGAVSGAVSGLTNIANTIATVMDKSIVPDQARGKVGNDSVRTAMELNRIDCYSMAPKASMCKIIDDYWTAFGYPIHEITTPQINSRSSWNYVKTVDCAFTADAEMNILSRYRDIFNKGVTIWHTNDIGNYNLSNV